MPSHEDVLEFSNELVGKLSGYHLKDQVPVSRVVLLSRHVESQIDFETLFQENRSEGLVPGMASISA